MNENPVSFQSPAEFERIYRENRPRVFAVANRVLRDPSAAEDVVQDVFTTLWRRPRAYDARRGPLRSYLTLVARSRAIDMWRSDRSRDAAVERYGVDLERAARHERPAADEVIRRDIGRHCLARLDEIPAAQREAVLLAYGRQMTAGEIAEALGVPVGTAKSRIRLGLSKMRESGAVAA